MEEVKKQIDKNIEELTIESKKRPEEEIEIFQKATKNLDLDRQLLISERQKVETEIKKLSELKEDLNNFKTESQKKQEKKSIEVKSQGSELVLEWLNRLELSQYYQKFIDAGYETLEICSLIEESELIAMDINKLGHRKALLNACTQLKEKISPGKSQPTIDEKRKEPKYTIEPPIFNPEERNTTVTTTSTATHQQPMTTDTTTHSHPLANISKPDLLPSLPQRFDRERPVPASHAKTVGGNKTGKSSTNSSSLNQSDSKKKFS